MNRRLLAAVFSLALLLPVALRAEDRERMFTVYLVRHAEKSAEPADPGNPGLSDCGKLRAERLALQLASVELEKIYSTDFERTLATAGPVAEQSSLGIETYDPGDLEEFSLALLNRRQNSLVVGHSNTTPVLAGLLAGEKLEPFDEAIYDRLYLVTVAGKQSRMTLLHQAFHCGD